MLIKLTHCYKFCVCQQIIRNVDNVNISIRNVDYVRTLLEMLIFFILL